MKIAQIKIRMSKKDLESAAKKFEKLVEKLPDGGGDLREYYIVTVSYHESVVQRSLHNKEE